MNKLILKKIVLIAGAIFVVFVSFWLGGYIASNQVAESINRTQAKLAFRHLKAYEEIYSYLSSDCKSQAVKKLEFLINEQKMLMAEYVKSTEDREFNEYVSLRKPELISELRNYHIDWDKGLTLTGCNINKSPKKTMIEGNGNSHVTNGSVK